MTKEIIKLNASLIVRIKNIINHLDDEIDEHAMAHQHLSSAIQWLRRTPRA